MNPKLLDPEVLKSQDSLTEEQREAVRERAYKEARESEKERDEEEDDEDPFRSPLDKKEKVEDEEEEEESEADKKVREEEESKAAKESEEAEAKKAVEEKAQKLEAVRKKEEKDLTDEEKGLIEEDKKVQAQAREEDMAQYVESYSEKFGLSSEQAKKHVEKIYTVLDKYKKDPKEMAQALYHLNSKLSQAAEELSAIKNAPKEKEIVLNGKKLSEEESKTVLVEKYREFYKEKIPGIGEMSDETVFGLAWKEYNERKHILISERQKEMKGKAEEKRQQILENIPEEDKKFLKEIRGAVYRADDFEILDEGFDVQDYVNWARGRNYHKDMKAAVEKAVAEALKDKKIVGAQGGGGGVGGGAPAKKGSSVSLTSEEKERALDMYRSLDLSDDEKFKNYQKFKDSISKKKDKE